MKKLILAAAVVGAFATVSMTASVPAVAREAFSFSFDTGAVAFAYSDGYWDRSHTWHSWRNAREAREYRSHYSVNYNNRRHTREKNQGWRGDADHDGVPNGLDSAPNNPRRN